MNQNAGIMGVTSKKIEHAYDIVHPIESYIFIYLMCAIGVIIGSVGFCLCWHVCKHFRRRHLQSDMQNVEPQQNTQVQSSRF